VLIGSGIVARKEVRSEYRASVAAYMECLPTHVPKECKGLRFAMAADERQRNDLSGEQQTEVVRQISTSRIGERPLMTMQQLAKKTTQGDS
jgi:hypothetical protein